MVRTVLFLNQNGISLPSLPSIELTLPARSLEKRRTLKQKLPKSFDKHALECVVEVVDTVSGLHFSGLRKCWFLGNWVEHFLGNIPPFS